MGVPVGATSLTSVDPETPGRDATAVLSTLEAAVFSAVVTVVLSVGLALSLPEADAFELRIFSPVAEKMFLRMDVTTAAVAVPTMVPMSEPVRPICDERANETPAARALASTWANEKS